MWSSQGGFGYQDKRRQGIVPQSERPTGHVGTRRDTTWDTILPGWDIIAGMGHKMGHHSAQMGHQRTPMDTILVSHVVIVKRQAGKGVSTQFSDAQRPKNQVTVAKADPKPLCTFRQLWYNPRYKLSAQQGWRHGVRLRSLGGTHVAIFHNVDGGEGPHQAFEAVSLFHCQNTLESLD